ncbi:GNAT family N-acetyltransferase [Segetibacter aerophilus]|uniref:BioF2-like acetyltransferase domain-containing protein n=1 Tax=Segetibacter aerophilus TaxID=670293 RepID=A0A512BIJ5_9BACT|nr:GNAT family N-acetyltransferase [Segetibacter aerophilus]GEO11773.1 hypothetical protein SAE01_42690 [Segetibacter aerophilus]
MAKRNVTYRVLNSFDERELSAEVWNKVLAKGTSDVIFMTWQWQRVWWKVFGRGNLSIIVAEQENETFAIAPLFSEYGMLYFVGSGGSDYLDFIGDIDEDVLGEMLRLASNEVEDFAGFQFYHIPKESKTNSLLVKAAQQQRWKIYDEGGWVCPRLELSTYPEEALAATRKKSLLRHESYFKRNGEFTIKHLQESEEIKAHLDDFFEQHINRWATTRFPSLFLDVKQKEFFNKLAEIADATGWMRFTAIISNNAPVAYHFGFNYKGNFFWYKPSFDIQHAKHSPGEVLLRQLLLQALEEGAHTFDFGLGEEVFKDRFATSKKVVKNWGLYKEVARKVLVISPHPDDESIGCGGTIRKHIVEGDTVEVIFLTSGEHGGLGKTMADNTVILREEESKKAASILELTTLNFWREPDGRFEVNNDNLQKLVDKILELEPSIIYVPHENEEHPDHKAAAQLVKEVLNLLPSSLQHKPNVLMYEVWTPIQKFQHVVDITPYVEVKRNAIAAYDSQCSMVKFHEAIIGLNRYRGEMHSWPGGDYAEIFKELEV